MIKVLIIDDSIFMQKLIHKFLSADSEIEIIGICENPYEALEYINTKKIDCIILDLEMPKMDGLTFLSRIKNLNINTIILSSLLNSTPELRTKLIAEGAAEAFAKPTANSADTFNTLIGKIKDLYHHHQTNFNSTELAIHRKTTTHQSKIPSSGTHISELILIASSTGGTEGVKRIIKNLPTENPPTVVVIQHMPENFTKLFAQSINNNSIIHTKEATYNDQLLANTCYVAKGNYHLEIVQKSVSASQIPEYKIILQLDPPVHSVRPAADVTFLTLPIELAPISTVVVLSGMGKDGAAGLKHLKNLGAHTIAESEASCTVFGMPKMAIATGCVDQVLSLNQICDYIKSKKYLRKSA